MARISKEQQAHVRRNIKMVAKDMFTEVGFEETSTKQIAKKVGIAEGTLFNYYDSKTELFFDAFADEYQLSREERNNELRLSSNISEMIMANFEKTMGLILKLPRGIIGELTLASAKMAKRKPERFKRLMELDFQFIDDLKTYLDKLILHNFMIEADTKYLSEIIFAIIGYEMILYMYETSIKKESMKQNVKGKLDVLLQGYVKGVNV